MQVGALIFSSDNNVLNYISFAGTIVSIILATIAIVYSFVQTISQQNASSNISNQVDKLISVVDQMHDSKDIIQTSIDHLQSASIKLDTAIESQSNTHKEVQTISNKLSNFDPLKSFQLKNDDKNQPTKNNESSTYKITVADFSDWNDGIKLCILIFYWGSQKEMSLQNTVNSIAKPIFNKLIESEEDKENAMLIFEGVIFTSFQALKFSNLISSNNNKIHLNKEVEDELKNNIEQIKELSDTSTLKKFFTAYSEMENNLSSQAGLM